MNPYLPYAPPGAASGPAQMASAGATSAGLSELAIEMLRQTRPWVLFLGILSFIGAGLVVIAGIGVAVMGLVAGAASNPYAALVGLVYIPFGLLYIYPGLKLVKYGSAIGRLMQTRACADLEDAMTQQKSLWKFSGIAAIVVLLLYVVVFIVAIAVGVSGAMKSFAP